MIAVILIDMTLSQGGRDGFVGEILYSEPIDARPFCNAIRAGVIVPVLGQNVSGCGQNRFYSNFRAVLLRQLTRCCARFTRHLIGMNAS